MSLLAGFLENTFWETISLRSRLSVDECKVHFPNIHDRLKKGHLLISELSPQIKQALDYYLKNYKTILHD